MKTISRVKDLTGKRYGRLQVIGVDDTRNTRKTFWYCQCDCGNIKSIRSDILQSGNTRSCGCLKKEQDKINLVKNHYEIKAAGTRLYDTWQGMKARCYNKNDARYGKYGGRGITICDEWLNSFPTFRDWALNNGYADTLTIDRIDNDGCYCPENCRWATNKEQANNRRSNVTIQIGNSKRSLKEWCGIFQLDYGTVSARYHRNGFNDINDLFSTGKYRGKQ